MFIIYVTREHLRGMTIDYYYDSSTLCWIWLLIIWSIATRFCYELYVSWTCRSGRWFLIIWSRYTLAIWILCMMELLYGTCLLESGRWMRYFDMVTRRDPVLLPATSMIKLLCILYDLLDVIRIIGWFVCYEKQGTVTGSSAWKADYSVIFLVMPYGNRNLGQHWLR